MTFQPQQQQHEGKKRLSSLCLSSGEEENDTPNQQQESPPKQRNLPPPPRSFIKTSSSPSLSFRLKKSSSLNEVLAMEAKLDIYCNNDLERGMLYLVANRMNVMMVIGGLYLLGTLYCFETMSWGENVLNIVLFLAQMINNRRNIDLAMSYGDAFRKLDGNERKRALVSILLYTTRYLLIPHHKILFLPVTFMWFAGSNKLYHYSTFMGLLPTYYMSCLYIGTIGYLGYFEYMANGYNVKLLDILIEHCVLLACIWMFSYYWINVTGFLKHKVDKLQETRKQLETAIEARSRFMAHVSHEFRCPIMSSLGCLELLKETELNDKQNDLVDTIVSSNGILLLLIEDILQIVKLEHNNKEQKKEDSNLKTFNLFESLKSMKGIIQGYASNFKVNLNFNIDERIKQMIVRSDSSKLHQILSNLMTNAVKASKQDGEVRLKCEVLEETGEKANIRFVCQDFGCGIPQHLIPSIFEPFVQLQNNSQSKVPSTGLGLTTVSHLIKSLEGTINVESQLGKGSTFTVDLPFKLVHDEVPAQSEKVEGEDKRNCT
ncbi:predicted protein [Naegleria gruberi]|uniref:histidine kinase n=1 Tax=Naegleria gruberi TaxID=5762 RepID=D2VV32_NAEGR|nr:uncharacterized protein NAEGRDRAFT_59295 [Naegleria gruberi]EFC39424.1 predicted protein [Naegleria gruberi]|eukprot:XP_002672168.1 predicted protein [Naegleria gruberi strain NEG-M]